MKNIILGTSCYENAKSGNLVSISGDAGYSKGYFGASYKKLAPSLKLYEYYKNNPDNLSDLEIIEYYINEYYIHRLENIDIYNLLNILKEKFKEDIILLCHEQPSNQNIISKTYFCHRRLLADYIELKTGLFIPEISIDEYENIHEIKQPDYKPLLKKIIK